MKENIPSAGPMGKLGEYFIKSVQWSAMKENIPSVGPTED
jgi:hypothetical protein